MSKLAGSQIKFPPNFLLLRYLIRAEKAAVISDLQKRKWMTLCWLHSVGTEDVQETSLLDV